MRSNSRFRVASGLLVTVTMATVIWVNAGSLTPAPGPVAPTMKTLVEVEPRTTVDAAHTPGSGSAVFVISQPGSYYLTGNLVGASGKHGIMIDADNVTLDLNGFHLEGSPGTEHGIFINCCHRGITIRNGKISGWGQIGLDSGLGTDVLVENIVAYNNGAQGIKVDHGATLKECVAHNNASNGIDVTYSCTLNHCVAYGNFGHGIAFLNNCTFTNCAANTNSGAGFSGAECNPAITAEPKAASQGLQASGEAAFSTSTCPSNSTFLNCIANNNGAEGFRVTDQSSFQNCAANQNNSDGFRSSNANTFHNCTASENSGDGFNVGEACSFENCAATSNFGGGGGGSGHGFNCFSHCTFANCTGSFNSAPGIEAFDHITVSNSSFSSNSIGIYINSGVITDTTCNWNAFDGINIFIGFANIQGCTITGNGGNGILLEQACKVDNCLVANNGAAGIVADPGADPPARACQIRNNTVRQNFNDGIAVVSDSMVEGNHCDENGSLGRAGGNGAGIKVTGGNNRVDGNHLVRNDRGLEVTSLANLITRQAAGGNTTNYVISAGNKVAVIVVAPISGAISGSTGGAGLGTTDPWVNVAY